MRLLFTIDTKDYDTSGRAFIRHSARCIAIENGKVALIHSVKYDYYKFPGGGIEAEEAPKQAVIRETLEEAGLVVLERSIAEFGYVHRVQKSDQKDYAMFVQDNFYFLCQVENCVVAQKLDGYESEENFTLEWVTPQLAIDKNIAYCGNDKDKNMLIREAKVLQILIDEGYFAQN